jgi:hypothetical protein
MYKNDSRSCKSSRSRTRQAEFNTGYSIREEEPSVEPHIMEMENERFVVQLRSLTIQVRFS